MAPAVLAVPVQIMKPLKENQLWSQLSSATETLLKEHLESVGPAALKVSTVHLVKNYPMENAQHSKIQKLQQQQIQNLQQQQEHKIQTLQQQLA